MLRFMLISLIPVLRKLNNSTPTFDSYQLRLPGVKLDVKTLKFQQALQRYSEILSNPNAAKLVFVDQFGVEHVTSHVFRQLVNSPTCDFLFFLSSSTLHRFRDHPAIKHKITRPDDYYQKYIKRLLIIIVDFYRHSRTIFFAPFSIKKGSNIYGIIFGSAHPLGMDKFLQVAWQKDQESMVRLILTS